MGSIFFPLRLTIMGLTEYKDDTEAEDGIFLGHQNGRSMLKAYIQQSDCL